MEDGTTGRTEPSSLRSRRSSDQMQDTMPWVPEDDPVLRELRAWRDELGESSEASRTVSPADMAPATVVTPTAPAFTPTAESVPSDRQASSPAARPAARPRRRHAAQPGIAGGVNVRRTSPPTHPMWDVMSSHSSRSRESMDDSPDVANATASTVAFPSVVVDPAPSKEIAIEVTKLHKRFGDFTAVHDVSFSVPKGSIVALLGPNGAGKTTTVNMLCTLLKPDGGSATVAGHDIASDAPGVRRAIMLTGQFAALDESLTGKENLVLFGRLLGMTKKHAAARSDELLEEFGLTEAAGRRVGQYSGGMRRRIDIACGLVTQPDVVFLDEPTTGLDPRSRQDVWNVVEQLRASGVTILLTTQYLEEADMLSDSIVVIDAGRVIAEGTSDELKAATGAAYCEITPAHPAYLPRLRARLRDLIVDSGSAVDSDSSTLSVPAPNGPQTLAEVMRRTEAAKIPLADIALRRPSLDEVFLALTADRSVDGSSSAMVEDE